MDLQHVDAEQFASIDCLNTDAPQTYSIADKSNALCMSLRFSGASAIVV